MNRREGLKYLSAGCATTFLIPSLYSKVVTPNISNLNAGHLLLDVAYSPYTKIPADSKIPFDWDYFSVGSGENYADLKLNKTVPKKFSKIKIRLTTALKISGRRQLKVSIPGEDIVIGIIDLRFAPVLQIVELEIGERQDLANGETNSYVAETHRRASLLHAIKKNGIRLRLIGVGDPIFFLSDRVTVSSIFFEPKILSVTRSLEKITTLLPHLFFETDDAKPLDRYFTRLYSLDSLQEFGWMEGCVLDGLWQIHEKKKEKAALQTIKNHLALFLGNTPSEKKHYDLFSIESTLPLAIIARLYPDHPILKEAEEFWKSRLKDHGGIVDYSVTAEGSYTVAWPLAVLSKVLNRPDLAKMALQQLRIRKYLVHDGNNYLRFYPDTGNRTYKNWARGIAWYMLGIIRTISVLKDTEDIDDMKEEFLRVARFALKYEKADGLFNCYIDDNSTITDTSGSAGIAAAIATGVDEGLLSGDLRENIKQTWKGLIPYLTSDGLLTGVSQSNSGGEELQKSDYRVISQMGMGLMAQLYAFLDS